MRIVLRNNFIKVFGILFLVYSCQSVPKNPDTTFLEKQSGQVSETVKDLPKKDKDLIENFSKGCITSLKQRDDMISYLGKQNDQRAKDIETLKADFQKEREKFSNTLIECNKKAEKYNLLVWIFAGLVFGLIMFLLFKLINLFKPIIFKLFGIA